MKVNTNPKRPADNLTGQSTMSMNRNVVKNVSPSQQGSLTQDGFSAAQPKKGINIKTSQGSI